MTAYNAAAYLHEAVNSILVQSLGDFEFVVIDNGSSDDTGVILRSFAKCDSRMRVYYHEQVGLGAGLDYGCRLARGDYIAFMDADDVSLARRLEKQLSYLEEHPNVGIVGTWIEKMDQYGAIIGRWCPPTGPKALKWIQFFGVCVASPTVLVQRRVLEKLNFVRSDLQHAVDVDLWLRASLVADFGNVPEVLYKYRVWPRSTTQTHLQAVRETHVELLTSFIKRAFNVEPTVEAVRGLRQTRVGPLFESLNEIRLTADLIQELYKEFVGTNELTQQELREISRDAAKRIAALALQAACFDGPAFFPLFLRSLRLDPRLLYPASIRRGLERHRSFAMLRDDDLCRN